MSSSNSVPQNRGIVLIMLALVAWGTFLALGAFLFDFDARKFYIVAGAFGAFLMFWLLLLVTHRRGNGNIDWDEDFDGDDHMERKPARKPD